MEAKRASHGSEYPAIASMELLFFEGDGRHENVAALVKNMV